MRKGVEVQCGYKNNLPTGFSHDKSVSIGNVARTGSHLSPKGITEH